MRFFINLGYSIPDVDLNEYLKVMLSSVEIGGEEGFIVNELG